MLSYKTECCGNDKDWVIFLHGLGGNSNIWYKQVKAFSGQFNLMFIDMFGHGDTNESKKSYTFETLAAGVIKVMDYTGVKSAHIVGISLGSIIADAVAFAAPDRVKSLVMGGSVLGYDFRARFLLRSGSIIKGIIPYMWLYRLFAFIMMPRKNHAFSKKIFVREAKKLGGREFKKWYRLMETLEDFYKAHAHLNVNVPKLYISGEQDHLFLKFVINAYLCDGNAAIHVIDRCGHVCNIEQADEFNRIALYYMNCYPSVPALKYVPVRRFGFRAPATKPVPIHKGLAAHSTELITFPADRRNAVNG
ncbi:MAG: alpha/beta hydrolase [Deltaproteobacteria bacterium]|nr:alpha/beta hydrolase [Deltaproteobacteria bacterium]